METNYIQNAINFAERNNIKFTILKTFYGKHFPTDTESRYIFKCKLSHGRKSYTFDFGQSLFDGSKEPDLYDVLSCLQKYDVGSFHDFCSEFGYDICDDDSHRIYKNVCKEFSGVERVFSHCLEELSEIE